MLAGFKKFLMRGNVVDLAVAVVIGAAFGKVVSAVVDGLITPLIAAILGKPDYSYMKFTVNGADFVYGDVVAAVINFVCVAAAIYFLIVTPLNHLADRRRARLGLSDKPAELSETELLTQIRDLLRERAQ